MELRMQDVINVLMAIWLFLAPWVLHFYDHWASVPSTDAAGAVVTGAAGCLTLRNQPNHTAKT